MQIASTAYPTGSHSVADLRRTSLGRRVKASPAVLAVLVDLTWPPRDGAVVNLPTFPASASAQS